MALTFTVLDGRQHDREGFACGVAALDDYLRRTVPQAHIFDASGAAARLGNAKAQNMVLMGMTVHALGLEALDWHDMICRFVPEKLQELNIRAFDTGLAV